MRTDFNCKESDVGVMMITKEELFKRAVLSIFGTAVCLALLLNGLILYNSKAITYIYEEVQATVIDKTHTAAWQQLIPMGDTWIPIYHPEENDVIVRYEDVTATFNDERLYNSVEVGDLLDLYLRIGTNAKGLEKSRKLVMEYNDR